MYLMYYIDTEGNRVYTMEVTVLVSSMQARCFSACCHSSSTKYQVKLKAFGPVFILTRKGSEF